MQHRDHLKSTRERNVTREVMKLELRQARRRPAGVPVKRGADPATITPPSTIERNDRRNPTS
jgi:hypothetical protein